jgi:hypothetical protein
MIKRNTRRIRRKSNPRRKNQKGGVANELLAATALGISIGVYASREFSKRASSPRSGEARVAPARSHARVEPKRPYATTKKSGPIYSGEGGKKRTKRRTKKRTKRRTKKRTKRRTKKRKQRGGRANVNWHEGSPLSYYGYPKNVTYDAGGNPNGIWAPNQY